VTSLSGQLVRIHRVRLDRSLSPRHSPTLAVEFAVRPCVEPSAELGLLAGRRTIVSVNSFWTTSGTEVVSGARTSQGLLRECLFIESEPPVLALNLMGD
jgi:hypothetical protein